MGKDQLLELGFLTEEEKVKLQKVLAADENLQKAQYNHFIKKHKELYSERKECLAAADPATCPLCAVRFGWFTNTGDVCPVEACQLKVCSDCRVPALQSWMCSLCHKEKDLKAQAGYWFQQPAKNKKRVKTGTDILKKSLDHTLYNQRKESPSLLDLVQKSDSTDQEPTTASGETSNGGQQLPPVPEVRPEPSPEPPRPTPPPPTAAVDPPRPAVVEKSEPTRNGPVSHVRPPSHPTTSSAALPSSSHSANPEPIPDSGRQGNCGGGNGGPVAGSGKTLKAPHIRDIKGQSVSADSGFINDDHGTQQHVAEQHLSEMSGADDDDDSSSQLQRFLTSRSVPPDKLAPPADSPPSTPLTGQAPDNHPLPDNVHQEHEPGTISAGASSSNISYDSISPSPTMIKANTRDRKIHGELSIGLFYNEQVSTLDVHINEGRNLSGVDGQPPNCFIKTYLLPDRSKTAKRKTKVKKRATNPNFSEIFQYKAPSLSDLAAMTLWFTAWDTRQLGHNMFLGEVRVQLDSVSLDTDTPSWWPLSHLEDSHFRGSIFLGLMYCPSPDDKKKRKTALKLKVIEARDLPVMESGRTNPYAAIYMLPRTDDISKDHKYKLQLKKNTVNPKWNAEVNFMHLDATQVDSQGIEVQILHLPKSEKGKKSPCGLLGIVRLCQHRTSVHEHLDGRGIEVLHWKEALSRPGVWIEKWHNLRGFNSLPAPVTPDTAP